MKTTRPLYKEYEGYCVTLPARFGYGIVNNVGRCQEDGEPFQRQEFHGKAIPLATTCTEIDSPDPIYTY
jgi:hypothetical protein